MPKVLLVEDDNNLREIFEMRLQAEGYDTLTAGNGEEGLTVAMKERPDLIITDVMMPKLSGFEMLETLRSAPEGKDIKVIMMTALGQAEDQARGEKLGVIKYLVKSQATLDDFARVVREVLPAADPASTPAPASALTDSSQTNQPEGNNKMSEDPTTPTPADPVTPPADNPMSTPPSDSAPAAAAGDQQSTSQEADAVQSQINDFVANTPAEGSAAPSADSMTPPTTPSEPTTAAPADPGMSFTPSAPADATANPITAPGAPDMGAPSAEPTSTDAPLVPPATPPADTPPVTPPQTDAPAPASDTNPPTDTSANAI